MFNDCSTLVVSAFLLLPFYTYEYLRCVESNRINMGHAVVFGLEEDLGMDPKSNQFNTALTIFFVPYVLLEVPSNIVLKKLQPHVWCMSLTCESRFIPPYKELCIRMRLILDGSGRMYVLFRYPDNWSRFRYASCSSLNGKQYKFLTCLIEK